MLPAAFSTLLLVFLLHLLLLVLLLLSRQVQAYVAPGEKVHAFADSACPAFLTFNNAVFLAGVTVELPCQCKPRKVESVVWFFKEHSGEANDTRALSDHHGNRLTDTSQITRRGDLRSRFTIRLFSLLIFHARVDDTGVYICGSNHNDFFYAYDLDIQVARVLSYSKSLSSHAPNQRWHRGSTREPYRVFTSFQQWSVCDRCGVPGEQVRTGLCFVHSYRLYVRYRQANQTVVSCGSGAVPEEFRHLTVGGATAEVEVRGCYVNCTAATLPKPKQSGVKGLLGIGSSLRTLFVTHPTESELTIACPGARPDKAVAWDWGSRPIYRYEDSAVDNVSAVVNKRLTIDVGHNLVFKPAKTEDSGTYYCWVQGHRVAEIRVLIHARLGRGPSVLTHPEFPSAAMMVLTAYAIMMGAFCLVLVIKIAVRHREDAIEAREQNLIHILF